MASASISPAGLPDATLSHVAGVYTLSITGLTGLSETPRDLTVEERRAGIVSSVPPIVTATDARDLDLLAVRAIEAGLADDSLLADTVIPGTVTRLRHQLLIAQVTRVVRLALLALDPPS